MTPYEPLPPPLASSISEETLWKIVKWGGNVVAVTLLFASYYYATQAQIQAQDQRVKYQDVRIDALEKSQAVYVRGDVQAQQMLEITHRLDELKMQVEDVSKSVHAIH